MPAPSRQLRRLRRARPLGAVALAASLVVGLAGCGSSGGDKAAAAGSSGGSETINVVVHSSGANDTAWNTLAADFEKANPNVDVKLSLIPTENFQKVKNARLTAGDVDVTEGNSSGSTRVLPDYVPDSIPQSDWVRGLQAGLWTELKGDYLNNWAPGVRKVEQYQGKDYGVPTAISYITGVYYNKDLFAKYNLQVPKTWDEFVKVMDTFKSNDVTPIVMGGAEKWPVGLIMEAVVDGAIADQASFVKGLWTGTAKFTDPQAVGILEKIKQAYSYAPKTFPGLTDSAAASMFTSGKAAMFPQGSWEVKGIEKANPSFQYGYFPLPGGDDPAVNGVLRGKLEALLAVPSNSKHKDAAEKFLAFFSDPTNYQKWVKNIGAIPVQPNINATDFINSLKPYVPESGYAPTWGEVFVPNPKAGAIVHVGFPYAQIAPMGTENDMNALAEKAQQAWDAARK